MKGEAMDIENIIDSLLSALWYDYNHKYVIATVIDIKHMIVNMGTRSCTEYASYIFKVLVLLYGDYGVAPAVGWIEDKYKKPLIEAIDKWCKDMHVFESEDDE